MSNLLCVSKDPRSLETLAGDRYAVVVTPDAAQALSYMARHAVDAILLDSTTWDISLSTLARWIRAVNRSVPMILLWDPRRGTASVPSTIDAVVAKDASADVLAATIDRLLSRPEPRRAHPLNPGLAIS